MDRLQQVELVRTTPMSHWKAGTVQAWLEVVMAMPMYVKACAENVKSGKVGHLQEPSGNAPSPSRELYRPRAGLLNPPTPTPSRGEKETYSRSTMNPVQAPTSPQQDT